MATFINNSINWKNIEFSNINSSLDVLGGLFSFTGNNQIYFGNFSFNNIIANGKGGGLWFIQSYNRLFVEKGSFIGLKFDKNIDGGGLVYSGSVNDIYFSLLSVKNVFGTKAGIFYANESNIFIRFSNFSSVNVEQEAGGFKFDSYCVAILINSIFEAIASTSTSPRDGGGVF